VTLDKKEVIEGGVVTVHCSVPEEKPPIHFTIEKLELDTKIVKQKRVKSSPNQNFVTLDFPIEEQDHVLVFRCQARIVSGIHMQISESIRSELVTVRGQSPTLLFVILHGLGWV
jgi:integrin beta 3